MIQGFECIKDTCSPEDSKERALLFSAIFAAQERAKGLHDHWYWNYGNYRWTAPAWYYVSAGQGICLLWLQEGLQIPAEIRIYHQQEEGFRMMKENSLLNYRYNYRSPARRVVESTIHVMKPNEVWEMDIKYVYIQGENRTAYLFAIIDCYTREVVGKHIGYHCTSQDVKMAENSNACSLRS